MPPRQRKTADAPAAPCGVAASAVNVCVRATGHEIAHADARGNTWTEATQCSWDVNQLLDADDYGDVRCLKFTGHEGNHVGAYSDDVLEFTDDAVIEAEQADPNAPCAEHFPDGWAGVDPDHAGVGCEHGSYSRAVTK